MHEEADGFEVRLKYQDNDIQLRVERDRKTETGDCETDCCIAVIYESFFWKPKNVTLVYKE